jgi:hypothetical protein
VVDQEVFDGQLKADRFPFPSEGVIPLCKDRKLPNYADFEDVVAFATKPLDR